MLKLLLCLVSAMVVGVVTLQLRQQELELKHQATAVQNSVEAQQAKLWSQQLQIAVMTSPNAVRETVGDALDLVPEANPPINAANWLETRRDR